MRAEEPDRLYHDPALAAFYDIDNGWGPDLDYCAALARGCRSVLDLGCGTGRLVARLAAGREGGREAVGVDPAAAMLAVARERPGGAAARWVRADARDLRLGQRFDLVVMTGHAFQVFLTDADQDAVAATIAAHLAPDGRFVLDSRNPAAEEWREWSPDRSLRVLAHPLLGPVEAWDDAEHEPETGIVTYRTQYRTAAGQLWSASSRIRFTPRDRIAASLEGAGLSVDAWLGAWDGRAWVRNAAEIIPLGRRADNR